MEKFIDFLHNRAQNLIQLQRRRESFAKLMKDRHFASLPAVGRETRIAAAFDTREELAFRHFSSIEFCAERPLQLIDCKL
jgi:hypothetical protein